MTRTYEKEQNLQAKKAIAHTLINAKMAAEGDRPLYAARIRELSPVCLK